MTKHLRLRPVLCCRLASTAQSSHAVSLRTHWASGTGVAAVKGLGDTMTAQAQAQDTGTAAGRRHRSDAGMLRLTQRDIDGLVLCGEHYGAPFDLLGAALGVSRVGLPQVVKRWRNFGYATNGRLGPGPAWCWLTREGMTAAGLRYSPVRPALSRIAHIRA